MYVLTLRKSYDATHYLPVHYMRQPTQISTTLDALQCTALQHCGALGFAIPSRKSDARLVDLPAFALLAFSISLYKMHYLVGEEALSSFRVKLFVEQ